VVFQNNILSGVGGQGAGAGITVDESCLFNPGDSPRLYRTPTVAGNQVMGSLSLWYKRSGLTTIMQLFNAGAGNDITFNASDQLTFADSSGVSYITTQVFRDTTAWGHLLFAWNTSNATAGDRLRIYHNGVEITAFGTETDPSAGDTFGISKGDTRKTVGANESDTEEFDGYLSQVYLVDGQQLTPTDFGEFSSNGVWRPIAYSAGGSTASALTLAFTDSAVDSTTQTTFTFSSVDIGTAASDRKVVVAVGGQVSGSTQTSVTVGGESCTLAAVHSSSQVGRVAFWEIDLATGTSEDIVVVFGQSNNCAGIGVWALTGDMVVYDTIKDSRSGNPTGEITCPAGSVIMGYELVNISPNSTFTWAGITENFDATVENNQAQHTGASLAFAGAQDDLTITVTPSGSPTAAAQAMVVIAYAPRATTYGTTGFKFDFADSADLGNDVSGLSNDYTSSGLDADDQVVDTPTNNFPTILRNTSIVSMSEGNLQVDSISSVTWHTVVCTLRLPSTGKWCYEVERINNGVSNHGFMGDTNPLKGFWGVNTQAAVSNNFTSYYLGYSESSVQVDGVASSVSGLVAVANGGLLQMLLDQDAGTMAYYANGVLQKEWTGNNTMAYVYAMLFGDTWGVPHVRLDFGQNGFTRVDTDYNYISTANFPEPTILDGTANFQTTLYTGDGSIRNIDQTENSTFQPDFVWLKNRSQADDHMAIDAARGVTKQINPDGSDVEVTDANGLTSFDADGFGLGTGANGYNDNLENFVAWQWLAGGGAGSANAVGSITTTTTTVNTTAGISIGTYTGTGVAATIGHGLGVVPAMVIAKCRNDGTGAGQGHWYVYHGANTTAPETDYLLLNTNAATVDLATIWNDTTPTSTVFSIGTGIGVNENTNTYIYYAFADVEGFSHFGNYIGNGNVRGAPAIVGFKPAYVMIKKTTGTGGWVIYDSQRSPYNEIDDQLIADTTAAETTGSEEIDFTATGFQIRTADSDVNTSAANYIYAAFAEHPFGGGEDVTPATTF